ncbi:hypothetical protein [Pantoea sp. At-9b]|uniref:hypothetical protein n=1 Tax=Pantoea sp. (strain At-9b) TaxID=592316 RepID=UPI0001B3DECA|nr:hypothetical protein [Pantoea sp. At-9b]ADU67408.1 hypothetical protein Pat9b_0079 [Pantoea sp. At-9b]
MTISIHGRFNQCQNAITTDTINSNKPLLAKDIKGVNNIQKEISSNKTWKTVAAISGTVLLGTGVFTLVSWLAPGSTALVSANGTNAENTLINNAISHDASPRNPLWDHVDNITGIELNIVTSKNETFSDNLTIEPHRIFTAATSFRDSVRAMLFNDYMKLVSTAGAGGINRHFSHSLEMAISKGEKVANLFNRLVINNARSEEFSPQNIDAMKKIVDRLMDEVQHLKEYKGNMDNRIKKRIKFDQDTAKEWHAYFQSSFNKIDEMINALLEFKHGH